MKHKQPLVTIIMTAYNEALFIEEALTSLMRQTYRRLEIIVVDDGSTDKTMQIIKKLQKQDRRIRTYQTRKNQGPSLASNLGLKYARGKYIARLDADDVAMPERIYKQVKFLETHPDVVMVGSNCELIDMRGMKLADKFYPTTHKAIYEALFTMNPLLHPASMINRQLLPRKTFTYHNHSILAHDLELIFELSQYGKLANLPEALISYRQHRDSLSHLNPKRTFKATIAIRHKALGAYGYKPTIKGWLVHGLQILAVTALPEGAVYPLFNLWRLKSLPISMWLELFKLPELFPRLNYAWRK